jgi:hypothetical protein
MRISGLQCCFSRRCGLDFGSASGPDFGSASGNAVPPAFSGAGSAELFFAVLGSLGFLIWTIPFVFTDLNNDSRLGETQALIS